MTSPPPPAGSMQLYDSVTPAMPAGLHRVTSAVTFQTPDAAPAVHHDFVNVGGSALHIQLTEVLACHPPRNATGGFDDELPHVVLRRRTLPWERPGVQGAPWLALLLFLDEEVTFSSGPLSSALPGSVVAAFGTDDALATATADFVHVNDQATLNAVLAAPAETALLSHVRRVNLADTALDIGDDDGWLAVVAANRLPVRPADGPGHYHACLVSLEHREDLYSGKPTGTSLILLYRWDFITDSDGTFQKLCEQLDIGTLGAVAGTADSDGRLPLPLTSRKGVPGTGLYRGPFTVSASAAAPDAGDVSYDAAYELGRMLAAADGAMCRELVDWHRASASATQTAVQHAKVLAWAERHGTGAAGPGALPPHVQAAAAGVLTVLRTMAVPAPHRRAAAATGEAPHG